MQLQLSVLGRQNMMSRQIHIEKEEPSAMYPVLRGNALHCGTARTGLYYGRLAGRREHYLRGSAGCTPHDLTHGTAERIAAAASFLAGRGASELVSAFSTERR
eukprot:6174800-Pleurochrysis_carterae.AAC.1